MQLDRGGGGSEEASRRNLRDSVPDEEPGEQAREELDEGPAERAKAGREGLPKRFRMRHGRHYVDELLGDAPIRTVREIPISEIEAPPDEPLDLDALEGSIRRLGVLEPILVARRGLEYRVIAGMRRLRAARTIGLNTVPCLVHEVEDERLTDMRHAAAERLVPPPPPAPPAPVQADVILPPERSHDLSFLSALLPAMGPGIDDNLRLAVLTELAGVELLRAKIVSAASDALMRHDAIERTPTSIAALVEDVTAAVAVEARLRGIVLESSAPECTISMDPTRCRSALVGLLQCLLSLTTRPGITLRVRTHMTAIRPALIMECRLLDGDRDADVIADAAVERFFDREWAEHPCGESGALVLASLARTARAHGGRVQVSGSAVIFVIPRPLGEV